MLKKDQVTKHISQRYNQELEDLRQQVMNMGGLVEGQLSKALNSLVNGEAELAEQIIKDDALVNDFEVKIDEECIQVVARRQPAAGDLRLIMAISKATTDLERVGDEARKIAMMARALDSEDHTAPSAKYLNAIKHLGEQVENMLHHALDAFARLDSVDALSVITMEEVADNEYDALSRQLLTYMMEDPRKISGAMDVLWAARALERIGDHAVNIAEHVVYAVHGQDIRHGNNVII